ncbi:MAG: hypothetical protein A2X64_02665 [Ignavibacteria bacterium GWF2_33_9]|nr:MAG: hypothetical protein A2X64_02665 [Ignavibacteria bacterium GWF2_33_9]
MKLKKNKISFKFYSIILIFSILSSSFGFTFYYHHCKTSGKSTVSFVSNQIVNHVHNAVETMPCCSPESHKKISYDIQNELKLNKDCCTQDEDSYSLSEFNFAEKSFNLIVSTKAYIFAKESIENSKVVESLEKYYKYYKNKIVKPFTSLLRLISQVYSSNSEDNTPTS